MTRDKWVMIVISLVISGGIGILALYLGDQNLKQIAYSRFHHEADVLEVSLARDMRQYENALLTAGSLFAASEEVTRDEWHTFVDSLDMSSRLPGASSFFYAVQVPAADVPKYVAKFRQETNQPIDGVPIETGDLNFVLQYIEPSDPIRLRAVGYNIALEDDNEIARNVMEGKLGITGKSSFPLTTQALIIVHYLPIVREEKPVGAVALAYRTEDFFESLLRAQLNQPELAIQITDNVDSSRIFTTGNINYLTDALALTHEINLPVGDRTWKVSLAADQFYKLEESEWMLHIAAAVSAFVVAEVVLAAGIAFLVLRDSNLMSDTNRIRSELVSIISHQVRTPLTSIKWMVGILRDEPNLSEQERQEYLANILSSSQKMIDVANDLLLLTKIETGENEELVKTEQSITYLLELAIKGQQAKIEEKNISIDLQDVTSNQTVFVDRDLFVQALSNVIKNAIDYSPVQSTVTISTSLVSNSLVIKIQDQGIGIKDEDMAKLFTKFHRGTRAKRFLTEGSGLGLYLAKSIIENHNGSISFEPRQEKGAVFIVRIPISGSNLVPPDKKFKLI